MKLIDIDQANYGQMRLEKKICAKAMVDVGERMETCVRIEGSCVVPARPCIMPVS